MIPKFSIRQLLWAMIAIGILSLCMSSAARGNRVAFGISVAVMGSVVPFLAYSIVHWFSFSVAMLMGLVSNRRFEDAVAQPAAVAVPADSGIPPEAQREVGDQGEGAEHV